MFKYIISSLYFGKYCTKMDLTRMHLSYTYHFQLLDCNTLKFCFLLTIILWTFENVFFFPMMPQPLSLSNKYTDLFIVNIFFRGAMCPYK